MTDLYPTKTRLRLLAAVAGDEVIGPVEGRYLLGTDAPRDRIVTACVEELIAAGWVAPHPAARGIGWAGIPAPRPTSAGYNLLAEHFPQQWSE